MSQLITTHNLSTTGKSTFTACNAGTITAVNWTPGAGSSAPAGMSVQFQDVADQSLGQVDDLKAGATSVAVPATIDASKIASVHFVFNGAKVPSWNFCIDKITLSYQ